MFIEIITAVGFLAASLVALFELKLTAERMNESCNQMKKVVVKGRWSLEKELNKMIQLRSDVSAPNRNVETNSEPQPEATLSPASTGLEVTRTNQKTENLKEFCQRIDRTTPDAPSVQTKSTELAVSASKRSLCTVYDLQTNIRAARIKPSNRAVLVTFTTVSHLLRLIEPDDYRYARRCDRISLQFVVSAEPMPAI